MKLDYKLVRKIMLTCEEQKNLTEPMYWNPLKLWDFHAEHPDYSKEEIAYTLILMEEAGFIDANVIDHDAGIVDIVVYRLTYSGHEFLDTLRSPEIVKKIESAISSVGSASLSIILELGKSFLASSFGL